MQFSARNTIVAEIAYSEDSIESSMSSRTCTQFFGNKLLCKYTLRCYFSVQGGPSVDGSVRNIPVSVFNTNPISSSSSASFSSPQPNSTSSSSSPPLPSISSRVRNIGQKKICCRKGCLKCVDTPSYRDRTIGSVSGRRGGR